MKKAILTFVLLGTFMLNANAQIFRSDEFSVFLLERYDKSPIKAAIDLKSKVLLDENKAMVFTKVITVPNKTKEELFVALNYWLALNFDDYYSKTFLNDAEQGVIIRQDYIRDITFHSGFSYIYFVDIKPLIRCDIKDGKVRIVFNIPSYRVKYDAKSTHLQRSYEYRDMWTISECFPFLKHDSHKKTSSKALVFSHAYASFFMMKTEEYLKNDYLGKDNW